MGIISDSIAEKYLRIFDIRDFVFLIDQYGG